MTAPGGRPWREHLTTGPDTGVIIVTDHDDDAAAHWMDALPGALPAGSSVVMLEPRHRAVLDFELNRSRAYHRDPTHALHGPHTQEMAETIDAATRHADAQDAELVLIDNGYGGMLVMPRRTLVLPMPLPDDHPLLDIVERMLAERAKRTARRAAREGAGDGT